MNVFRYLVAKYRPQDPRKPLVNIGVIVQSDSEVTCKYNPDIERVKNIVGATELIDAVIFQNMEDTFKQNFKQETLSITDKVTRERKQISYKSPEYLEYLTTNFLNSYVFDDQSLIEAENIEDALSRVFKLFVESGSTS